MIVAGNKKYGLAKSLHKLYPDALFCSRSEGGYDLTKLEHHAKFAERAAYHDEIILCSALWKFNQTVLLDAVYKKCLEVKAFPHIICVGSTTDRVKNGSPWLYNAEKKALRDYCNTLAIGGVWGDSKPKVSYISVGTLSNNQDKHPGRKTMNVDQAAEYVKWLIDQPTWININEISIDPMQSETWYA